MNDERNNSCQIGGAIGAALGAALERRHKDKLRPPTEDELKSQKRCIRIGLAIAAILGVFLVVVYLLQAR